MSSPIQCGAVNGKRKMHLADYSLPATAKSTKHFQLRSPVRDRPLISTNPKFLNIYCRCGHGFCKISTFKSDGDNDGRSYYTCPIERGKKCKEFVKWCDHPVDHSELCPPLYQYPMCSCGAGVCRKVIEMSGPDEGRYFFACPIEKGSAACDFHLWEDTLPAIPNASVLIPGNQNTDGPPQEAEIVTHTDWSHQEDDIVTGSDWLPQEAEMVTGSYWQPQEVEMVKGDSTGNTYYLLSPLNYNACLQDTMIPMQWESPGENARSIFHPSSTTHVSTDQDRYHTNASHVVKPEEHIQHCEGDKVRLHNMRDTYVKVKTDFEASQQPSPPPQSLQEEASRLKLVLQKVEEQIASWEVEAKEMKTRLSEIKARMMEAEESVKKLPVENGKGQGF